jgi:hypothetical protein
MGGKKKSGFECDGLTHCPRCDWNENGYCECWEVDIELMRKAL